MTENDIASLLNAIYELEQIELLHRGQYRRKILDEDDFTAAEYGSLRIRHALIRQLEKERAARGKIDKDIERAKSEQ